MKKTFYFIRGQMQLMFKLLNRRILISSKNENELIDEFNKFYYYSALLGDTWRNLKWFGIEIRKCPTDLFIYQEIIHEIQPDFIVECGTAAGGSALYFAHLFDMLGNGKVITIEKSPNRWPTVSSHPRIKYLHGDSVEAETQVKKIIGDNKNVIVVLDSNHHKQHVLNEMTAYSSYIQKGNYMIVEDTNLNGHPVSPNYGNEGGPMEAVDEYMRMNSDEYEIDHSREKLYLTQNPNGYLKKIR